jgi:Ca2+-binding EF-hand superfamily protein
MAAPAPFNANDYCIPGEITVHEVQDMKRAFDMIDEDHSGLIDAEELQGAAVALGIPMEENIAVLLGTDKVSFDEFFKRMTAKLSPEDTADDILNIFELFDHDCTGTISFDNLQNIARIIGAKESPTQIQDMLTTLDTDGDGELDPHDFYTCLISGMRLRLEEEARIQAAQADQMKTEMMQMSRGGGSRMGGGSRNY